MRTVRVTSDVYVNPKHVTHLRQDGPNVVISLVSGKYVSVTGSIEDVAEKLREPAQ